MASFESIFPTFLQKCADLHDLLLVVPYLLFIVGVILRVIHGFSPKSMTLFLARLLVLTSLLVFLPDWGNRVQEIVQTSILDGLGVNPENVHDQYSALLVVKRSEGPQSSWWNIMSDVQGFAVEKIITGFLYLVAQFASLLLFWAYVFQKVILHIGYALSPILIGFMAVQALHGVGARYLMNLVGLLLWPLGWAVAALITQGILDFMTDPSFKFIDPTNALYTLQSTFGAAVLGFWIVFSTVAAPVIIQKVLSDGIQAGSALLSGGVGVALQTARTTVGAAAVASTAGSVGTTVGAAGLAAMMGVLSSAAGLGNAGGIIIAGSGLPARGRLGKSNDDITGDRAVRDLIAKQRRASY